MVTEATDRESRLEPLDPQPLVHFPMAESLARQLPEAFARERRAVPLCRDADLLVVAMADPADVDTISSIQEMMRCRVRPMLVRETDIDIALDRAYHFHEVPELWPIVARVALATGFLTPHQVETIDREYGSGQNGERAASLLHSILTEEDYVEILSLALNVPRARLDNYRLPSSFTRIIPYSMARECKAVPVFPVDGQLLVASPGPIPARVLQRIRQQTGYEPLPVLCTQGEFQRALERGYGSESENYYSPTTPIWQQLVRDGSISEELLARAQVIQQQSGQPLEEILPRLDSLSETQMLRARAQMYGVKLLDTSAATVDLSLARSIPEAVARRFRCIPLRRLPRWVQIAVADPGDRATREMMEFLLDSPVQPLLAPESWMDSALDRVYSEAPTTPNEALSVPLEEYLVRGGLISRRELASAMQLQQKSGKGLEECLLQLGLLEETVLIEAMALRERVPWISPPHYRVSARSLRALPRELAEERAIMPVYRDGHIITLAASRPLDEATRRLARQIAEHPIQVVLAPRAPILDAVERLYAEQLSSVDPAMRAFGERLVHRGLLSRQQLLRVWAQQEKTGVAFDVAVVSMGFLSEEGFARAVADDLKLPLVDLTYRLVPAEVIDGLGHRRETLQWTQPVDALASRLLSEDTARRYCVIPFREVDLTISLAIVVPLEEGALLKIQEELGHPISLHVATRAQVEEAIRRVHDRRTLGDLLVETDIISRKQLEEGLALHKRTGVRLGKALISLGHVSQEQIATCLSEQLHLPFFSLSDAEIPEEIARIIPESLARTCGMLPLDQDGNDLTVAMTDPMDTDSIREVEQLTGCVVRPVLTTENELQRALERIYQSDYLWASANDLVFRYPDESASRVLIRRQKVGLLLFALFSGLMMFVNATGYLTFLVALSTIFYVTFSTYKFYLIYKALSHSLEVDVTEEEIDLLEDRDLPVYTVLVPLYREAEVLPTLIRAIDALDYPKAKMDVKLLLEEDDRETIEVVRNYELPAHFKPVVVPNSLPKGKPKACNYGLIHAEGEYVVIYDAEDIPDSDQLKRALLAFRKAGQAVSCIQAKLNYYNRDQNLLTRWFTTEYSMWFDLFIPGLDASNAPIPLGGTSNHFRTSQLRELGAWDPFNVTEDADLGVRLFKAGGKTAVIDSTTYEEANSEVYNWIRQRSRWVKGYIQTYLVHMRHPLKLIDEIGLYQFLSFNLVVGGTFFGFLVNPVYWLLTSLWFLTHWGFIQQLFPGPIFYIGAIGLYLGNFAFMYTNVAGCMRRGYYDMVKYALLSPLYWAMMSVGAWKGFLQLFYRPSYWEKTKHGLYTGERQGGQMGQDKTTSWLGDQ